MVEQKSVSWDTFKVYFYLHTAVSADLYVSYTVLCIYEEVAYKQNKLHIHK